VTHDQRLIDECECELWVVQEQDAKKWPEGFDDYKSDILDKIEKRAAEEEKLRSEKIEAAAKAREEKMAQLRAKLKGK
jgi:ATPase subunit of ABC transporter with duplicated ATPase domains